MMETQVLIQEIQKKHQITLKPDDPVFVVVTLNELLLSHYLEKFQALLEKQNKLVASQGIERLNQASAMGSEMINRSLEALSQTLAEKTVKLTNEHPSEIDAKRPQYYDWQKMIANNIDWCMYSFTACAFFVIGIIFKTFFHN
ncbi:hypothetical protein [Vampirovibrio sp.]|uniref:hypothetical protein n=1 Tax=Vampirovibrio sp. TaxID=2717857 RepID=UPI003593C88E